MGTNVSSIVVTCLRNCMVFSPTVKYVGSPKDWYAASIAWLKRGLSYVIILSNHSQFSARLRLYKSTRLSAILLRSNFKLPSSGSACSLSHRPKQAYACVRGQAHSLTQGNERSNMSRAVALAPGDISLLITLPAAQIARPV